MIDKTENEEIRYIDRIERSRCRWTGKYNINSTKKRNLIDEAWGRITNERKLRLWERRNFGFKFY
jgi:hypothetical protein